MTPECCVYKLIKTVIFLSVKMKKFNGVVVSIVNLSLIIFSAWVSINPGHAQNALSTPKTKLFQVDEGDRIIKVLSVEENAETTLEGGIKGIRLECNANYPVQWLYSGNGVPVMEVNISRISETEYRAIAFISRLTEQHTGKYKCSSTESPNILTYYYIYVPGPFLFNMNSGKALEISSKSILIPCTVSSPRINVYLQKPVGNPLERPAVYDPRRGFSFQVEDERKAEGVYLCKATYRGTTNVLEFQVKILLTPENPLIQSDHASIPKPEGSPSEVVSDVPCNPPCAENAKCVFTSGKSVCKCLSPFKGEGYNSCQAECTTHTDCSDDTSCFADFKCRDPCINAVHGLQCGANAGCKTIDHQPTCACKGGFYGDPLQGCQNYYQGDAPKSPPLSTSSPSPLAPSQKRCDCGPDCECICRSDNDCDNGHFCNGTMCQDPCEDKSLCGTNALCKAVRGVGLCSCPRNYIGDPWKSCRPHVGDRIKSETFSPNDAPAPGSGFPIPKRCERDEDCPSKYKCDNSECLDPCLKCVSNAECDLFDGGIPKCQCPEGYTGDGTISCTPDVKIDISKTTMSIRDIIARKECSSTSCGPNGECRVIDGFPKCNCISGFVGNPPKCRAECTSNSDCRENQACVQKKCRNACYGKCGKFARCSTDRETKAVSCNCRSGYTGDPKVECYPINTNKEPRSIISGF